MRLLAIIGAVVVISLLGAFIWDRVMTDKGVNGD